MVDANRRATGAHRGVGGGWGGGDCYLYKPVFIRARVLAMKGEGGGGRGVREDN
jgi:hypothetical protein